MNEDEEILQDFLTEAGEILEQVSSQLIELESNGDDVDLLNGIFRGFHTVKGGASFLGLEPMVLVCHDAEDVFNALRQGERGVDGELMDVVLKALDAVNTMFEALRAGDELPAADPRLLQDLKSQLPGAASDGDSSAPAAEAEPGPQPQAEPETQAEPELEPEPQARQQAQPQTDAAEAEFEAMLAAAEQNAGGSAPQAGADPQGAGDEITDEEFERLLDALHGPGSHQGVPAEQASKLTEAAPEARNEQASKPTEAAPEARTDDVAATADESASDSVNEMTEDEFDALLDKLHGKGGAPGQKADSTPAAADTGAAPVAQQPSTEPAPARAVSPAPEKPQPQRTPAAAKQDGGKPAPRGNDRQGGHAHREAAESTIRVETRRLDEIMNLVGELVLVRNRLSTLKNQIDDERVAKTVFELDAVTTSLQDAAMQTRMQPVKKVFGRFPRVVRDLARHLEKEVTLELRGEDTDLDKNLVEALADPLVHLVRNAVDHGIEYPAEREAAGKPRRGTVILSAEQEGDHILLEIRDDGGGMDAARLREIAVSKGVISAENADRLSDREAFDLIFAPGFSTRQEVSDVSGRGVGMDVVKTSIERLNGKIEIRSQLGKGTTISIQVPLTLAILPTMMVGLGGQSFALPLACVGEIFNIDPERVRRVDGREVVLVRDRAIPVFRINEWFAPAADRDDSSAHVVMVNVSHQRAAFVVDSLIGQEEVVIKPLGSGLHGLPGFAGATITGDGGIALIIDVAGLLQAHARAA